jgi:malonyl-CoA/methylmalonyl-CoA synthetase
MNNFIDLLEAQFQRGADRPALVYREETISYGKLEQQVKIFAAYLQGLGLVKGDRVALYSSQKFPLLVMHLGVIVGGGVSVPLNFQFTKDEVEYYLQDSGARFVFYSKNEGEVVSQVKDICPGVEAFIHHKDVLDFVPSTAFKEVDIVGSDPVFMMYSSGTTGRPKGIVHNHKNVGLSLLSLQSRWKFTQDDVLLNVLPLYHLHGLSFGAHLSLITGNCMMIEDTFLHAMDQIQKATVFFAVPTIYYAFLNRRAVLEEKAKGWGDVRLFTCGSAPIRSEVLPDLESIINNRITNRYGMTESHVITSLLLDGPKKQGSVGTPIDGIEMKIVGATDSLAVGEVVVKSDNLFGQYWNRPDAMAKAFDEDGYFHTGDLGSLDSDGFLTLFGRMDDLIIIDGENVYPSVVERVLNCHAGVRESAVVGVLDARRGERIVAAVVANDALNIHELEDYCKAKLAPYQWPSQFEVVDKLPRNTMSKVLKRSLVERFTDVV